MNLISLKTALFICLMTVTPAFAQSASNFTTDTSPGFESSKQLNMLSAAPNVLLKQVDFIGNSAVSTQDLTLVAAPYLNRELPIEELESLRQALIQLYVSRGYINSGVIIPDQKVREGIITFTVIEGGVSTVAVEGLHYYSKWFLTAKLNSAAARPLNVNKLQDSLQLLQQDSRIKRINAELVPGTKLGDAELNVKIREAFPLKVTTRFSNDASPSTGSYKGELIVAHQNLFGLGDTLSAHSGITEGALDYGGRYSIPVSLHDTTLDLYYSKSNSKVIEEQFDGLDIKSESETFGVKFRQPFLRSSASEFAVSLTGEKRSSISKLLGQRYSFSPGEHDGESKVSVVRFTQEWTHRTAQSVAGIYSTFNYGIAVLGATTNSDLPDGRFGSWVGQGMLLSRIASSSVQGMVRVTTQLALDQLLPLEKFPIGGFGSVRGYRANTIVRDNGINSSAELRIPLFSHDNWPGTLQLVPFVDFGWGWNTDAPASSPDTLTGTGGGFRWQWGGQATAEAYYGYGLHKMTGGKKDLQDQGIHFQLTIDWL